MRYIEKSIRIIDRISSPFLDHSLKFLAHRKTLNSFIQSIEDKNIRKLNNPKDFLVVPDINIGDALNHQAFIEKLKQYLPESKIDYIYKKKAFPLIKSNPFIDRHYPLLQSSVTPSSKDLKILTKLLIRNQYDIVFNFCPYLPFSALKYGKAKVIHPIRFMAKIIKASCSEHQKMHVTYQLNQFAKELVHRINSSRFNEKTSSDSSYTYRLYLSKDVYVRAEKTAEKIGILPNKKTIFFNPDSSSPYTLIPLQMQTQILKAVLSIPSMGQVLMNRGRSYRNIEKKILNKLSEPLKEKVLILPLDTPIDVYAALTDKADIFISADTGPMHISAAKKVITDSEQTFKNQTALIGIFGATPSRLYGYDSFSDKHIDSAQNAPAKSFEGHPSCKNITCIDKAFKNCSEIKCFDGIDPEEIIAYIKSLIHHPG
jgi:ADP-heptose:LPS heptosyltransferase